MCIRDRIVGPVTDVVFLLFNFDNTTGNYEVTMTASAANPFLGDLIINVALFNPDTGTTASEFFIDDLNEFSLDAPTTSITLTGSDTKLLDWKAGDRVAACEGPGGIIPEPCSGGLGQPSITPAFQSGVINFQEGGFPDPFLVSARDSFQSAPAATIAPIP